MTEFAFDSDAMSALKSKFDTEAVDIQRLRSEIGSQVDQVIGTGYKGPAANAFRDAWTSEFSPSLQKLQDALTAASSEIQNRLNAGQQAGS